MPATFINSDSKDRVEIDKYLEGSSLTYIWDKTKPDIGDRFIVLSSADTVDKANLVTYRMSTLKGISVKDALPEIYESGILVAYEEILKKGQARYCGRLVYEDEYLEKTEYDITAIPCLNCEYRDIGCDVDIIICFYKEVKNSNLDLYMKSSVIEDTKRFITSIQDLRIQMGNNMNFNINDARRIICDMFIELTKSKYAYMNKVTMDNGKPHKQIVTMLSNSVVRDAPQELINNSKINTDGPFDNDILQFLNTDVRLAYNKSLYTKTVTIYNKGEFKETIGNQCPFKPNGTRMENIMLMPLLYNHNVIGHICVANSDIGYTKAKYQLLRPLLNVISDFEMAYEQLRYLKTNQIKLTKSSELQRQFFGNLSHELRTPMNSINVASKLLLDTKLTENQERYATLLTKTSKSMMGLIEDLIQMTRFESGSIQPVYETFDIKGIINEIIDMHKVSEVYNSKNIRILTSFDNKLSKISCDKKLFKQLVSNIVHNAIKFTEKGFIEIRTSDDIDTIDLIDQEYIRIEIEDTGVGIKKDDLNKIFNRFVQINNSKTYEERTVNGLGLGLSIVTNIIEILKGTIDVQSTDGVGTKFIIKLPIGRKTFEIKNKKRFSSGELEKKVSESYSSSEDLTVSSSKSTSSELSCYSDSETESSIDCKKASIILVEDVQTNIDVVKLLLEKYENVELIQIFTNGQQFYDWYCSIGGNNNVLVLMDAHMPVLDGYQATKKIRMYELDKGVQKSNIVGLSASVINGDEKAVECGMDYFMDKPIDIDIFDKVITKFSEGHFITKKFMESL